MYSKFQRQGTETPVWFKIFNYDCRNGFQITTGQRQNNETYTSYKKVQEPQTNKFPWL